MPTTSLGFTYPASTGHARIWEHIETLAGDVNDVLTGAGTMPIEPYAITNEAKITPTLLNGWVAWGSPYQTLKYWKDKNGVVHIDGLIKSGTTTSGTQVFGLPVGYRPAEYLIFMCGAGATFTPARLDIENNGSVKIGATGWSSSLMSLSGISFKAEQ